MVDRFGPGERGPVAAVSRMGTRKIFCTVGLAVASALVAVMGLAMVALPVQGDFATSGQYALEHSPDGLAWTPANNNRAISHQGVAYGNGTWVAAGSSYIERSTDGRTWSYTTPAPLTIVEQGGFTDVAFGNGVFVVVGKYVTGIYENMNIVYVSPDGLNWTPVATAQPRTLLNLFVPYSVAFGQGKFVAVGGTGFVMTSQTGYDWVPSNTGYPTNAPPATVTNYGVAYANNLWVTVGTSGTLLTSANGILWEPRASGVTGTLYGIAHGNGLWVATGASGVVRVSLDGINWGPPTATGIGTTSALYDVNYGNGRWVAVGSAAANTTTQSSTLITSLDGYTWKTRPVTASTSYYPRAVAYDNNQWVAVGYYATLVSTDGLDWIVTHPYVSYLQRGIATDGDVWVSVGYGSSVFTSTDGYDWIRRHSGYTGTGYFYAVTYGAGKFVAVGDGGRIATSTNGVAWTQQNSGTTSILYGVTHGPGQFVAVGAGGAMRVSTDGVTWTAGNPGTASTLYDVEYGDGKYVIVGLSGLIRTSPDLVTWTTHPSGTSSTLNAVAHDHEGDPNQWVAVGASGSITKSVDGTTWSLSPSPTTLALNGVAAKDGRWVAVGGTATFSSLDAVTWANVQTTVSTVKYAVASDRVPPLDCLPGTQIVGINAPATIGGGGGRWTYTWTAPGSDNPAPAQGASVTRSYASEGTYDVKLTDSASPAKSVTCKVVVMLNPPSTPPPPAPTTGCGYTVKTGGAPLYDFTDIDPAVGGGGTGILGQTYLSTFAVQPSPPFKFKFCGTEYQTFWLSGAGYICLGPTNVATGTTFGYPTGCTSFSGTALPNSGTPGTAIYGFWSLLDPANCAGGSAKCSFYKIEGTAPDRVLIYEHKSMPMYWNSLPRQTFQIKLYEGSDCFEVHYKDVTQPTSSWAYWSSYGIAAGYETQTASVGYQYAYSPPSTPAPGFTRTEQAWQACKFSAMPDKYTFNEDEGPKTFDVTANDVLAGQPAAIVSRTFPTKGTLMGPMGGYFTYEPYDDANGDDSFEYTLSNGTATSTATVKIRINPVNDAPTLSGDPDPIFVNAAEGAYRGPGWGIDVAPGPSTAVDEAGQAVTFQVSSITNGILFAGLPTLERSSSAQDILGTTPPTSGSFAVLRFKPAGHAGSSHVCFVAKDDGGTATVTDGFTPPQSDTGQDTSDPEQCVDIHVNGPPSACFTASSMTGVPGQTITFATCSQDSDGGITECFWDFGDGTTSADCNPQHAYAAPGRYVVRLTVRDANGSSSTDSHLVTIAWSEETPAAETGQAGGGSGLPIADAGGERQVPEGALVRLQGLHVGGDGTAAFAWTQVQGPTVELEQADTHAPTFVAPELPEGTQSLALVFRLLVTHQGQTSAPDHALMRVVPANHAPDADAGEAQAVVAGTVATLDASRSLDADMDTLTFRWEQVYGPAVSLSDPTAAKPTFTAPLQPTQLGFLVSVSDGKETVQDETMVLVDPAVAAAAPLRFTYEVFPGPTGAEVRFQGVPQGMWDFGDGSVGRGANPSHVYAPGVYTVTMRASDDQGPDAVERIEIQPAVASSATPALAWGGTALVAALSMVGTVLIAVWMARRGRNE